MTDPRTLLADYAAQGSEQAFRELVERYLKLVYATAVRLVQGDTHLAEDVAQTVFADLARRSASLSKEVLLGGWLHRRTCHVAATLMRSEHRRQHRERRAAQMNPLPDYSEPAFEQIAPILDDAINQLSAPDRAAIVLRFFEERDLRFIGQALASNEDAAQKRVTRALVKLRGLLVRRGVTLSIPGLAAALAAGGVTAPPAGLAASISTTALASAAAGGLSASLLQVIAMTKLKLSIGAVILAGASTMLVLEHREQARLRAANMILEQKLQALSRSSEGNASPSNQFDGAANPAALPDDQFRELLRLRGEVALLRRQTSQLQNLQADNRKLRAASARQDTSVPLPPAVFLETVGWGPKSCQSIADRYTPDWLGQLTNQGPLVKLGMALYDVGRYSDALTVFQTMERTPGAEGVGLVWQGHILDLLGRRDEAVAAYQKAAAFDLNMRHDQYGLVVRENYVRERLEKPFVRVENREPD